MINQEEYEVLRNYYLRGIRWISRNKNGNLVVSKIKPDEFERKWLPQCPDEDWSELRNSETYLFLFIQWEDNEPYNIAELIEKYESEQTEVKKDLEWLKEKVRDIARQVGDEYLYINIQTVLELIDQLDQPEVLLRELPVIPKYVAEWIEGNKQSEEKWSDYDKEDAMNDTIHFTIYGLFADYPATNSHVELREPVLKWLSVDRGNYFKLVNAVRYGYEVEEEPLYRARLKVITDKFIASYLRTQSSDAEDRLKVLEIGSKYIHEDYRHLSEFTENELKRLGIWGSEQWEAEELE